ncbi:MAG: primosome assembly protein PriA [Candidatus Saccharibacteria bacterium]|nr:primosome assembly protein PriA [Candidatus Saccharibacteria bacterium]
MHYYEVAPNKIVRSGSDTLTYASATPLEPGHIVTIPVGTKSLYGLVIKETSKPSYDTKEVGGLIEEHPLPKALVELAVWLHEYYRTPLATVLQSLLPSGLGKKRRVGAPQSLSTGSRPIETKVLTDEQQVALATITATSPGTFLLQGVTGSGKTMVYIELAKQMIAAGRSVIVLIPEIALTTQIIDEFSHHFKNLLVTHSTMTEAQRHVTWKAALDAREPHIIIGPRSALFTPLRDIGAIIIDEAHEPSYKQEQSPRYSALRAATMLGRFHDAKVIFGSATPSVTDRYVAEQSDRPIIKLTKPARLNAVPPTIQTIDMTKRSGFKKHRFLSDELLRLIESNIESGHQTLIFHNRRGSASTTLCQNCGWAASCPRCFVPLALHNDDFTLRCHICNYHERIPTSCPVCHHTEIVHKGIGTKLVEAELNKLFPAATIARFDSDTKDDATVNRRYKELYDGTIHIAIGTQVVAKGLDLPLLRTVGIVQADSGLILPDYSSSERTFQLLAQVIGRVGRSEHETNVIVQTYQPNHPAVRLGLSQDYESFYEQTLAERRRAHFPPFSYLLKLTATYKTESAAISNARKLAATLKNNTPSDVQLLGPTPAFYERIRDTYRWQLVLKSHRRSLLVDALTYVPPTYWQFELDPTSLLS